jgi:uncharacterized repeat protein (TIGR03803 family)
LTFDQAGNIYGTTTTGGTRDAGVVFQLHPSNGGWTESVLYSFTGHADGAYPQSGVVLDQAGNLYGTTLYGGLQFGVVYKLSPHVSQWTESVLYEFQRSMNDGGDPVGGLIFDEAGNLYGATSSGGTFGVGVAYELTLSAGSWIYQTLHNFTFGGYEGGGPWDSLFRDAVGNLYGTQTYNPNGQGNVFKLTSGDWTETDLYDFVIFCPGGCDPIGSVVLDQQGNIYGATFSAGPNHLGVVWEISP